MEEADFGPESVIDVVFVEGKLLNKTAILPGFPLSARSNDRLLCN